MQNCVSAQALPKILKLLFEGEAPEDIFVPWKPIKKQPIGWNSDLNDGLRLNIWSFMEADFLRKLPTSIGT